MNKTEVVSALQIKLNYQIDDIRDELNSLADEMSKETKSSAGDKFETSREMMNQERGRLEERLAHVKLQLNTLNNLSYNDTAIMVSNGTLVKCDKITFFFGVAYGKLEMKNSSIMALSLNSPLGKCFLNKQEGDEVNFMGKHYHIKSIT